MYGLILALILFGFAAFAYQGIVYTDLDAGLDATPPALTLPAP